MEPINKNQREPSLPGRYGIRDHLTMKMWRSLLRPLPLLQAQMVNHNEIKIELEKLQNSFIIDSLAVKQHLLDIGLVQQGFIIWSSSFQGPLPNLESVVTPLSLIFISSKGKSDGSETVVFKETWKNILGSIQQKFTHSQKKMQKLTVSTVNQLKMSSRGVELEKKPSVKSLQEQVKKRNWNNHHKSDTDSYSKITLLISSINQPLKSSTWRSNRLQVHMENVKNLNSGKKVEDYIKVKLSWIRRADLLLAFK